jgi:uncharacterized RDD family membrane protein YckC
MDNNAFNTNRHDTIFTDDFFGTEYVPASSIQRFLNWIIDGLVMSFGVTWITGVLSYFFMTAFAPQWIVAIDTNDDNMMLFWAFIMIANHLLYYTLCERLFRGKTLGKLLTGTKVIREDGAKFTFTNALLRSIFRLVPFEPFSIFFDRPWHDSWTRTTVIRSR